MTIGKAIGGGIASGAIGLSADVLERVSSQCDADYEDTGGVGGTLAGNALSVAAMRATLEHVLTAEKYAVMIPRATRLREGLESLLAARALPWNVTQLGCRAEYRFQPTPATNGSIAHAASDPALEAYLHPYLLNRGVLITPFHNMVLISPDTSVADIERHNQLFTAAVDELLPAAGSSPSPRVPSPKAPQA